MSRQTVEMEDVKEQVITYLDKMQKTKGKWFTCNLIRVGIHRNADTVKQALYELATEGFLHMRHDPSVSDVIYYRLRRDGDQ